MSGHKQMLAALLEDLKAALSEPYASDRARLIDAENTTRRYRFFMDNPGSFEAAMRIMDKARGSAGESMG